jgi:hypothetical protein
MGLLTPGFRQGTGRMDLWKEFGAKVDEIGSSVRSRLDDIRLSGKKVAGFGAPAKATTLMHQFRLDSDVLDFIADDSPLKQGLFTPGKHVPVLPSSAIEERSPDFLLVLAWNFADSIIRNHASFREKGGRFIIPLPELQEI